MEELDVVTYQIFLPLSEVEKEQLISSSSLKDRLEDLKAQCLSIVFPIAEKYIWQHESFSLKVYCSLDDVFLEGRRRLKGGKSIEALDHGGHELEVWSADTFVPHVGGKLKFGDNLEDEWLVVYLLLEISRRFPTVSITVRDSDGEFLLIESSYFIPKWLSPENSHNRIFIRQGAVHIVPPMRSSALRSRKSCGPTSLKHSLQVLEVSSANMKGSPELQNVILERVAGYPEKAMKNVQRVLCKVPLPVAQVLRHEPQLIALAVESFYSRDMDSMKAASRMETFAPKDKTGNTVMVDTVVPMSRAMYAQLIQQIFQAPRDYPMPLLSAPGFKEAEIGMKIAVGFEMLYWELSSSELGATEDTEGSCNLDLATAIDESPEQESCRKYSISENDVAWQKYRGSLEKSGYFRGLKEGSKAHQELLQAAIAQYRATNSFSHESMATRAPWKRILELLSMPFSADEFSNSDLKPSDDDRWLYDGEADLATVMLARQKEMDAYESKQEKLKSTKKSSASKSDPKTEDFERLHAEEVIRNVQSFISTSSSFEGAEIPKHLDDNLKNDEAVDLNMNTLLKELESVFDPAEISSLLSKGFGGNVTDSSSEGEVDDNSSESSDELELDDVDFEHLNIGPTKSENPVEAKELKDDNAMFRDEYSDVLNEQLRSSSMAKSFAKQKDFLATKDGQPSGPDSGKGHFEQEPVDDVQVEDEDENDLVDVDVNLVESLLRSFLYQQGMPGPASNLLGSMGIELPDNSDLRPESSDKPKS